MLELQLRQQLSNVAHRIGRLWMWRRLTWTWVTFAAALLIFALAGHPVLSTLNLCVSAAVVATVVWMRARFLTTPREDVARHIERAFPDLNSRLLTALEQCPEIETGRLN